RGGGEVRIGGTEDAAASRDQRRAVPLGHGVLGEGAGGDRDGAVVVEQPAAQRLRADRAFGRVVVEGVITDGDGARLVVDGAALGGPPGSALGGVAAQRAVEDGQRALVVDRASQAVAADRKLGAAALERQVLQRQLAGARHVEETHRRPRRDREREAAVAAGTVDDDRAVDQKRRRSDAAI